MRCDSFYLKGENVGKTQEAVYNYLVENSPKDITNIVANTYIPYGPVLDALGELQKAGKISCNMYGTKIMYAVL